MNSRLATDRDVSTVKNIRRLSAPLRLRRDAGPRSAGRCGRCDRPDASGGRKASAGVRVSTSAFARGHYQELDCAPVPELRRDRTRSPNALVWHRVFARLRLSLQLAQVSAVRVFNALLRYYRRNRA